MKTAGIICEYNPFHLGHLLHINKTKEALGGDANIVCLMSGNFVQRGDIAVFPKHGRAEAAILCGADIVIEMPVPYALSSAGEFAKAGVYLLDAMGICSVISFGSECGNLEMLGRAAHEIVSDEAQILIKKGLSMGLPYAKAQQTAANALLGDDAKIFQSPNNTLGIEYIKALVDLGSSMQPVTIKRIGGDHDGDTGYSASALRRIIASCNMPVDLMPEAAADIYTQEVASGRGPVMLRDLEQALMSRLRTIEDFSVVPGATDGLDKRFLRYAPAAPSVDVMITQIKTKRFAMSRIRRVMMCAALGIKTDFIKKSPPYIRVLAMNKRGTDLLKAARKSSKLPIITKPASVRRLGEDAIFLFESECDATDFYVLAYDKESLRTGGSEWRISPVVIM